MTIEQQQIQDVLERINAAWMNGPTEGMVETIGNCFDESMVIVGGPDMQVRGQGRFDCANSYASFLRHCTLKECVLAPCAIHGNELTAIATCPWSMVYEHDGKVHKESGRDIFVFSKSTGRWLAIWRAMLA